MKVLIVEDDSASRRFLTDSVKSLGYEVLAAEDGEIGWRMFQREKPDLVISDIRMPRMEGLDLLSAIRDQNDSTIVIIITAYGSEGYAFEALRRRANNFICKPVTARQLHPMLRKYAAVVDQMSETSDIAANVLYQESVIEFPNRFQLVPQMASYLIEHAGNAIPRASRLGVHLGLAELLANAIEHGNLEITYEDKQNAGMDLWEELDRLMEQKLDNPHLSKRKVKVHCKLQPQKCEWLIEDEGRGFDWRSWPAEVDENMLGSLHGRGIFLSRFSFDKLEYIGSGNMVRATKHFAAFEE